MATEEVISLLKKYIILLNSEGISVKHAYLFGSYATDTATENSDIDLMIVSDNYNENDDIATGNMWRLTKKVSTKIEPFLIGINKFNADLDSIFLTAIKETGVVII
ncbi:MAG: nucleotidyltransferase domain-containing protein [Salinivirgaceae bacterium]|jgi:predicted nucleotidyltransferase|nr:nucleotidyltransferase domain-containing protein [Salinivirgaceae bacterium]